MPPDSPASTSPTSDRLVGLTVHSLPEPAASSAAEGARVRTGRIKLLLLLLVCASPVIASYLTYFVIRPDGRSNYATLIEPTREIPALPLTDLAGQAVDPASLRGQWLLVVVGPGACDAACEARLFLQRQLREMTGRERERIDKLWLLTDDAPVRPELREALEATPAMQMLRVSRESVAAWLAPEAGQALESHLYIVDPMGRWMMRAPAEAQPAKLKRDIERLLRASSSWDRAGR
jgi:hypothetical protein